MLQVSGIRRACIVVAAIGVSTVAGGQAPPPTTPEKSDVKIRLERGACFGSCPAYVVEITKDGSVTYEGLSSVAIGGRFHSQASSSDVDILVEAFRQADFFSLRDEYMASVTDNPFYIITLTLDGRTKKVVDYVGREAGMPDAVTFLEKEIDRVAQTSKYVTGTPETIQILRDTGFDFTSDKAGSLLANALAIDSYDYAVDLIKAGVPLDGRTTGQGFPTSALLSPVAFSAQVEGEKVARAFCEAALTRGTRQDRSLALIIAATLDDIDLARKLIVLGVDPIVEDLQMGPYTALHMASSEAMARLLLDAGINPDFSGPMMPVFWARSEGVALVLYDAGREPSPDVRRKLIDHARGQGWTRLLAKLGG